MSAGPIDVAGRYRLGESLGAGGMGQVWRARDEVLERDVAVKEIVLPADLLAAERDAVHRRMVQEARAAARLSHRNVAQVYDVIEQDGRAWIVMEYIASRSLQQVIKDDGPLDPRDTARIGLEVLDALEAAHRAGVRHRDVKPANVLLGTDGRIVLTDFGIASIEGDSVITTSSELVLGSPQYMSPERATDGTAEPASDLWSLGATLYAAVEGRSPYQRDSAIGTLTALAADQPDPPRQPGPLRPVLEGLLRKDPAQRIDAAETRRLLEAVLAPAPERTGSRRRPLLAAGATTLVLLAGGAAAFLATRPDDPGEQAAPPPRVSAAPTVAASSGPAAGPSSASPPAATSSAPKPSATSARPTSTGSSLPGLPSGWQNWKDPTGFSVYVPKGWKHTIESGATSKGMVYFRDGKGHVLGIDQTTKPQWNPVADWEGKESARVDAGDFSGYHRVRIKEIKYFVKAADWEYTYTSSGSRRHVNNRGVITSSHQAYGIYWATRDSDWDADRSDLDLIFASFRPKT
ncbi:serine/threonine-protein kinase [Actinoplanes sp. N902-109]|uniref:serine/threonine-protein kinase n=1 Tax=Actinoplanes sp. (strain N902-109) TaxID=649831 RepID=UPI0003294204|nr:serine/threonine-protein kinase [Actinoplanes sp. N902-109]AGL18202.1 serine/threonine protein kinase [Actinoplanes sp. N902-109]